MIEFYIEQASTYAHEIDNVINVIGVITTFWWALTTAVFFYFIWRFRYREGVPSQYVTGKEKHLKRWVNIPHYLIILCDMVVIVAAVRVWYMVKQDLPTSDDMRTVRIIGQQWAWSFEHPGPDGKLGGPDDLAAIEDNIYTVDELHTTVDTLYHYKLEARDVMHSFSVPVFRLKQDALPGRVITGWWQATKTGEWDIQCAEMCGIGHGIMAARIFVETPEEHEVWMQAQAALAKK